MPTVAGRDRFDAAYGIGYLHAQDRFFQMDYLRRTGAGELAELLGPAALDFDREHRLFRFRARAAAAFAQLPPDERRLLERYTQGVNDGLAALRARPFEYALLGEPPARWRPEDSLLVIWAMYFQVQGTLASRDIARNWLTAHATQQQRAFLLPSSSGFDAPLDAPRIDEAPAPLPDAAPAWFRAAGDGAAKRASLDFRSSVGSNNWAIAGSRSARGAAIVGDDMHLVLGLPNTWYRAAFTYPGGAAPVRRAVGVTLAGVGAGGGRAPARRAAPRPPANTATPPRRAAAMSRDGRRADHLAITPGARTSTPVSHATRYFHEYGDRRSRRAPAERRPRPERRAPACRYPAPPSTWYRFIRLLSRPN